MKRTCLISLLAAVSIAIVVIILVNLFISRGCEYKKVERGNLITEGPVSEAWKRDYYKGKWMLSRAITIDDAGNVYATGSGTVKYDGNGNRLWKSKKDGFHGKDIVADNQGNVYVIGDIFEDSIIKYDSDGDEIWSTRFCYPTSCSYVSVSGIALDKSGNVYILVTTVDIGVETKSITVKYDGNGNQLWVAQYGCPSDAGCAPCYGLATNIGVDESGNVFVTGNDYIDTCLEGDPSDSREVESYYLSMKYDSEGNQLWAKQAKQYKGLSKRYARVVAFDTYGNACVTGDLGTVKYSGDGEQLWDIPQGGDALVSDNKGNIYVGGSEEKGYEGETQSVGCVVKYDSNGNKVWSAPFLPDTAWTHPWTITVDALGNVYAVGHYGAVVKYNSEGHEIWSSFYKLNNQMDSYVDYRDIAVDRLGNVYVTGDFTYDIRKPFINLDFNDDSIWYSSCTVAKYVQLGE